MKRLAMVLALGGSLLLMGSANGCNKQSSSSDKTTKPPASGSGTKTNAPATGSSYK